MASPSPAHWILDNGPVRDRGFDQEDPNLNIKDVCEYDRHPQERLLFTYLDNEPVVSVDVGHPSDQTRFFMIRGRLATSSSKFLRDKVNSGWFEENESIELPQHTEATFKLYAEWLQHVRSLSYMADEAGPSRAEPHPAQFYFLASAFVLGEDLEDEEFKNFIIDTLLKKLRGNHGDAFWDAAPSMVDVIYRGTPEGSPARKLMADVFAYGIDDKQMRGLISQLPHAFQCHLVIAFAASRPAQALRNTNLHRCDYHHHG